MVLEQMLITGAVEPAVTAGGDLVGQKIIILIVFCTVELALAVRSDRIPNITRRSASSMPNDVGQLESLSRTSAPSDEQVRLFGLTAIHLLIREDNLLRAFWVLQADSHKAAPGSDVTQSDR